MRFLSSPYHIWEKGDLMVKKTVLRLVFARPLTVSRKTGVQTAETTYPFKALEYLERTNKNVVPKVGLEPTCLAAEDFESSASTIPPLGRSEERRVGKECCR